MLAYTCKECGQIFVFGGYRNEFNEYFCDLDCYEDYCKAHNYEEHIEKLEEVPR